MHALWIVLAFHVKWFRLHHAVEEEFFWTRRANLLRQERALPMTSAHLLEAILPEAKLRDLAIWLAQPAATLGQHCPQMTLQDPVFLRSLI